MLIRAGCMKIIRNVMVDGRSCPITISDENEALSAAYAAGGAIIGIWDPETVGIGEDRERDSDGFAACLYLVTSAEDVTSQLLERAARRHLDLPWKIAETERLILREFASDDPLEPESGYDGDGVFSDWEKREAYRHSQYRFSECGLWAVVEKESGRIVGKAGLTDGELGYHIYPSYRNRGYASEACLAVLSYAKEELELSEVFLKVKEDNTTSCALAEKLGFRKKEKLFQDIAESYCILYVQRI